MRKTILIILLGSVSLSQCPGGTFILEGQQINCSCTDVYIKRIETTLAKRGEKGSLINFNSTIGVDDYQNLVINIAFVDNKTDPTTNLDNPYSCIKPVFNKYLSQFFGKSTMQTPNIVSTYNNQTGYRTWSYTISRANFQTDLIGNTIYSSYPFQNYEGVFSIDFTAVGILQITYKYSFNVQFNMQTNITVVQKFLQQLDTPEAFCISQNNCINSTQIQASLQFCSTSDCATPTSVMNLFLYQNYWLLLSITNKGFSQYLLRNPILILITKSDFRSYTLPASKVNVLAGKTIISFTADFAYENVEIIVSAQLFPEQGGIQAQIGSIGLTATLSSINCIRYDWRSDCVSCADQCKINFGFASSNCPECKEKTNSSIISISILVLMMIFMC